MVASPSRDRFLVRSHGKGHEVEGRAAIKAPTPLYTTPAPTDNNSACKKPARKSATLTGWYSFRKFLYPEEQVPDLVDYLGVSTRLTAWEALIGGEDKVRCSFEVENGLHAIKGVGRFVAVGAVFDGDTPLAAPFAIDLDAKLSIYAFGRFLVHGILHEDEHVRHKYASGALVEFASFLAQTPLHIPGVNAIVHDVEGRVEERWQRTHIGMGDVEVPPFFECQGIENSKHLVRVSLEAGNGFCAWQAAECLGMLVESFAHYLQAKRIGGFTLASHVPAR